MPEKEAEYVGDIFAYEKSSLDWFMLILIVNSFVLSSAVKSN